MEQFYSPDIYPFWFVFALNPACSVCMDWCNHPGIFKMPRFCFAENTFFLNQYILTNFVIIINPALIFSWEVLRSLSSCRCSPIYFQSAMNEMSNSTSRPNFAAPGEALSTVWQAEQMAHAASVRKTLMSLGFTEMAILISDVHNMFIKTAWTRSSLWALDTGRLTLNAIWIA